MYPGGNFFLSRYESVSCRSRTHSKINLLKPSGFFTYRHIWQRKNSTWCSLCVECFVQISEQTATFALYIINWLVFITVVESVYSAVRTDSLYRPDYVRSLKGSISPLIPNAQLSLGLPRFLLPVGSHFITSFGSLPSSILWTCPYHWNCLVLISSKRDLMTFISCLTLRLLMSYIWSTYSWCF